MPGKGGDEVPKYVVYQRLTEEFLKVILLSEQT
jgi:hypothetical protein